MLRPLRAQHSSPQKLNFARFSQQQNRQNLFAGYPSSSTPNPSSRPSSGYGYAPSQSPYSSNDGRSGGGAFSAYPTSGGGKQGSESATFRSATPNSRGQYSDAVLDELENQNEEEFGRMAGQVKMLKGVSLDIFFPPLSKLRGGSSFWRCSPSWTIHDLGVQK